jgi:hypothetical protein
LERSRSWSVGLQATIGLNCATENYEDIDKLLVSAGMKLINRACKGNFGHSSHVVFGLFSSVLSISEFPPCWCATITRILCFKKQFVSIAVSLLSKCIAGVIKQWAACNDIFNDAVSSSHNIASSYRIIDE